MIKTIARLFLSEDVKTLINAKFLNDDLTVTERGRAAIDAIILKANTAALVELANERIAEDKEKCK